MMRSPVSPCSPYRLRGVNEYLQPHMRVRRERSEADEEREKKRARENERVREKERERERDSPHCDISVGTGSRHIRRVHAHLFESAHTLNNTPCRPGQHPPRRPPTREPGQPRLCPPSPPRPAAVWPSASRVRNQSRKLLGQRVDK